MLRNIANLRVTLYVIAALLAAVGIGNAFVAGFFQSKYEVVYIFDVKVVYCAESRCAYSAGLTIANTGRMHQDEVVVTIAGLPAGLRGSPTILNLSSAHPREGDPGINQQSVAGTNFIRITNFSPGALVEFTFSGSFPEGQLPPDGKPVVEVVGRGKMIEADPRAITLVRYLS